jgi:hypothetical protein
VKYLISRLSERSTWLGLIGLFTGFGISIEPEAVQAIATTGTLVVSSVAMFTKG